MSKRLRKNELEPTRQTVVKFFETLLRASADGIVITDSTHNVVVVNETFCTFFGRQCQDVVETRMFSWLEKFNADALNRWSELEDKVRLDGFCRNAEFRMTTQNKESYFTVNAFLFEPFMDEEPGVIISIWQDITERKLEQEVLKQKTHDGRERVKELKCLYGIANLVEQQDISLEEILQGIVDLIPPSWQYPGITCARIIIQGRGWKTKNFRETIWKQSCEIHEHGELSGVLEVYYREERPEIDEGPFLKEERNLINAIAGLTGRIVERKQAEESLRASEEKYRTLLETTSEGCWLINPELKTIEVNAALCKMLGYSQDEMIGKTPFDFVDDENRKIFIDQTSKISVTAHRSYEITLKKKNGEDLPAYFNATTIRSESGQVLGAFAFITDIAEKKRAEEALRKSEEQYRNIFKNIQDVYYEVTLDGIILEASPSIKDISLYKREEIIGKSLSDIYVDPKNRDEFLKELLKKEKVTDYEALLIDKDGSQAYCSITAKLVRDKQGNPVKIIGSLRNITERKQAEEHINILTQELMRAQENERQRISRDLHDHVAQELSAVEIGFETLFDHQPEISPEIRRRISEMSRTLQKSIKAIRDVSYDLRPPVLDEMGLVETLVQYCHDFSEDNGINVDFHSAGMKGLHLDFDTEINLYRMIQEGLTNIKKHADADHVTIRLVAAFPNIILRIKDNGKGFNVQKRMATITKEKRMGIHSMVQRAKLLQGEMEIQSRPMLGTKISITLPYKDKNSDSEENRINNR
ncbi:MAG: PAS domain S-box protein [Desulfobacterales bacterium]|jgi:PAS domain S-box-containing protein